MPEDPQHGASLLNRREFSETVLNLMEVSPDQPPTDETALVDDIGLDSLQMFQLVLLIEALANVDEPPNSIPDIRTLADAFAYYNSVFVEP